MRDAMRQVLGGRWLLAQQPTVGEARSVVGLVVGLGVVVIVTGVLLFVLSIYRRRLHTSTGVARGFTLGDLRALHKQGKLTDDEFARAKAGLVASVQAGLAKEQKPEAAPRFENDLK